MLIVFGREKIPGNTDRYRDVINVEKYFYTEDDFTFTNDETLGDVKGLKISANQAMDSARMTFVNPQLADNFSLNFLKVPDASKFTQMHIRL